MSKNSLLQFEANDDLSLLNGEVIYPLISVLKINKFSYFLRYSSVIFIDHAKILPTWEQFNQELVCIKNDDQKRLLLYTLPFVSRLLILPCSTATNEIFIKHYTPQVNIFTLAGLSTDRRDTFSAIKKCRRLQSLNLRTIGDIIPSRSSRCFLF